MAQLEFQAQDAFLKAQMLNCKSTVHPVRTSVHLMAGQRLPHPDPRRWSISIAQSSLRPISECRHMLGVIPDPMEDTKKEYYVSTKNIQNIVPTCEFIKINAQRWQVNKLVYGKCQMRGVSLVSEQGGHWGQRSHSRHRGEGGFCAGLKGKIVSLQKDGNETGVRN